MARDIFGNKKVTREDLYTKKTVSHSDMRSEYYKLFLAICVGYLYFHFIIMGWTW